MRFLILLSCFVFSQFAFALQSTYPTMHVAGSHNNWSANNTPMTLHDDFVWQAVIYFDNNGQFKLLPESWSLSCGDNNQDGIADTNGGGNIFVREGAGHYRIRFNDTNWQYNMVKVAPNGFQSAYPHMHMAGTHNNWNFNDSPMNLVDDFTWQLELDLANNGKFKFVPESWSLSFGDNDRNGTVDRDGGGDITVANNGTYTVTFNDQTMRYQVTRMCVLSHQLPMRVQIKPLMSIKAPG